MRHLLWGSGLAALAVAAAVLNVRLGDYAWAVFAAAVGVVVVYVGWRLERRPGRRP